MIHFQYRLMLKWVKCSLKMRNASFQKKNKNEIPHLFLMENRFMQAKLSGDPPNSIIILQDYPESIFL